MITFDLLKECRNEFDEKFKLLISQSSDNQLRLEDVRSHSLRVATNSGLLAKSISLTEEEVNMSQVIALFHDYGKAVMIVQGTESPINIQGKHADLSSKLVQQLNFYTKLSADDSMVILRAIENHNKLRLPKFDNEQQSLFPKLLRDADKIDIFEVSYHFFKEKDGLQPLMTLDLINQVDVSEKIFKTVISGKTAAVEDMKSMNDYRLLLLSMVFDLNFKYSFKILVEKQYIQKIYETLPKRSHIIDAHRSIKLFVENMFVF
jgi:5'-deoxynucleotidase YfbR-like HD superfamily hydrolase